MLALAEPGLRVSSRVAGPDADRARSAVSAVKRRVVLLHQLVLRPVAQTAVSYDCAAADRCDTTT